MAKTGHLLLEEVFYRAFDEYGELNLSEIEDIEGVTDYKDSLDGIDGWYAWHTVSFKFDNRWFEFTYKEHTSDNVSDTEWFVDSFKEFQVGEEFTFETSTFYGDDLVDVTDWINEIVREGGMYDLEIKLTPHNREEDGE